jgi:hypothetical protein
MLKATDEMLTALDITEEMHSFTEDEGTDPDQFKKYDIRGSMNFIK